MFGVIYTKSVLSNKKFSESLLIVSHTSCQEIISLNHDDATVIHGQETSDYHWTCSMGERDGIHFLIHVAFKEILFDCLYKQLNSSLSQSLMYAKICNFVLQEQINKWTNELIKEGGRVRVCQVLSLIPIHMVQQKVWHKPLSQRLKTSNSSSACLFRPALLNRQWKLIWLTLPAFQVLNHITSLQLTFSLKYFL